MNSHSLFVAQVCTATPATASAAGRGCCDARHHQVPGGPLGRAGGRRLRPSGGGSPAAEAGPHGTGLDAWEFGGAVQGLLRYRVNSSEVLKGCGRNMNMKHVGRDCDVIPSIIQTGFLGCMEAEMQPATN